MIHTSFLLQITQLHYIVLTISTRRHLKLNLLTIHTHNDENATCKKKIIQLKYAIYIYKALCVFILLKGSDFIIFLAKQRFKILPTMIHPGCGLFS